MKPSDTPQTQTARQRIGENEYQSVHRWIRQQRGKATACEDCARPGQKAYQWANISGEYKRDTSDWKMLCSSCHQVLDKRNDVCVKGHDLTDAANQYVNPNKPTQVYCRKCKQEHAHDYRLKYPQKFRDITKRNYDLHRDEINAKRRERARLSREAKVMGTNTKG